MSRELKGAILATMLCLGLGAPAFARVRAGVEAGPAAPRAHALPPHAVEVKTRRPSPNHQWLGGYWERQNDRWAWSAGRWEEPAAGDTYWIRPHYQQEEGGYRYEAGRWAH